MSVADFQDPGYLLCIFWAFLQALQLNCLFSEIASEDSGSLHVSLGIIFMIAYSPTQ